MDTCCVAIGMDSCWMCRLLATGKCEIVSENWALVHRPKVSRGFPGAKTHELFILRHHMRFGADDMSPVVAELTRSVGTVHESVHPSFPRHFHVHGFGSESPPADTYHSIPPSPSAGKLRPSHCWMCKDLADSSCDIISENWARVRRPRPSGGFRRARTHKLFILRQHSSFRIDTSPFVAELVKLVGTVYESVEPTCPDHYHLHGFGDETVPVGCYKKFRDRGS